MRARPQALWFDGFVVDLARGCMRRDGADVLLRPKTFEVLRFLVENNGRLLGKEEIISAVWKDAFVTDNSLVQCLIEIRRALGDDSQTIIRTIPRRGYIFDVAVTDEPARGVGSIPERKPAPAQIHEGQDSNPRKTIVSAPQAAVRSAVESPRAIRMELFGGFRMSSEGAPVTAVTTSRMRALLAFLLLNAGSTVSRQQLAFVFWPDSSEPQARTNLRQLFHHLRSAWPAAERYIEGNTQILRWRTEEAFTLDVAEFEAALLEADEAHKKEDRLAARQALLRSVDLYRGDLLPGVSEEWIETYRQRLKEKYSGALASLIVFFEEARDYQAAIRHAESLLAEDPFRETVHETIMRLHGLNGDRAEALRAYERCRTVLRRELGVEPRMAMQRMRERISRVDMQPPSASRPPSPSSELRLVGRVIFRHHGFVERI